MALQNLATQLYTRGVALCATGILLLNSAGLSLSAPTQPPLPLGARITDGPPIGGRAQEFALPDTRGRLIHLQDLLAGGDFPDAGQTHCAGAPAVTMLNFWAFWCNTWQAEMPSLRELAERRQEMNFCIAAVSVDGSRLPEFQRSTRNGVTVPFPVLLDTGGQVSAQYNIHHVPTVILLDRQHRVRYCFYGYPGNEIVLNHIRKIINSDVAANRAIHQTQIASIRPAHKKKTALQS